MQSLQPPIVVLTLTDRPLLQMKVSLTILGRFLAVVGIPLKLGDLLLTTSLTVDHLLPARGFLPTAHIQRWASDAPRSSALTLETARQFLLSNANSTFAIRSSCATSSSSSDVIFYRLRGNLRGAFTYHSLNKIKWLTLCGIDETVWSCMLIIRSL